MVKQYSFQSKNTKSKLPHWLLVAFLDKATTARLFVILKINSTEYQLSCSSITAQINDL